MPDYAEISEKIIDGSVKGFLKAMPEVERKILARLNELVGGLDSKGGRLLDSTFSQELVAQIENEITLILRSSGYFGEVSEYFKSFNEIETNLIKQQRALNKINLTDADLGRFKAWARDNVIFKMQGGGLDVGFKQPLKEALTRAILTGSTINDVRKELASKVSGQLQRYTGQVAQDSMMQYQGVVNQNIQVKYEMTHILYVGGLVKDSRPQCVRWVGMERIPIASLAKEIQWAYNRGSGMIPGTNETNFFVYRGGFNCKHFATPTRLSK